MTIQFDSPITTTDQSVDRVINAGLPVLFVFLDGSLEAGLAQSMESLARRYAGQLLIVKGWEKDNLNAIRRFQVNRLPAVIGIQKRQPVTKAEGITGSDLEKHAAYLLGKGSKPEPIPTAPGNGYNRADFTQPVASDTRTGQLLVVTDATFEKEVIQSPEPVLVDLWAPWCSPCRMVEPIIKKIAQDSSGRLRVAKVNVDENPAIAEQFNIRAIPTMMIVQGGRVIDQWTGALPEPALRNKVKPYLSR